VRKISFYPYELRSQHSRLNSLDFSRGNVGKPSLRCGALLRVQDENGNLGFADLHPWVEWGFPSVQDQLLSLHKLPFDFFKKEIKPQPFLFFQTFLSLRAAAFDLQMRKEKKSSWAGHETVDIKNNYLLLEFSDFENLKNEIQRAISEGFEVFKIKLGFEPNMESALLRKLFKNFPQTYWRLDFNSSLSFSQVENFFSDWTSSDFSRLEYVEDPCIYEKKSWENLSLKFPLALDQAWVRRENKNGLTLTQSFQKNGMAFDGSEDIDPHSFKHLVIKPAIQDTASWSEWAQKYKRAVTVTSLMDHPLGAAEALRQTLSMAKLDVCLNVTGLRTQFCFEPNSFSEKLEGPGPQLKRPQGLGLGFDSLLQELSWQSC